MSKNKKPRFGLFYKSNGRWAGPYCGVTFTKYTLSLNPVKQEIRFFANHVLKSRVKILPVA